MIRLTNGYWPPYLSEVNPNNGFASHIVTEAYAAVGVTVTYGFFPWTRAFEYARVGKGSDEIWHGSVVWVYTEERAHDFHYTDVVISDDEVLFYLKSSPLEWESVYDLKGMHIGGTLNTVYPLFEAAEKERILKIQRAGNYDDLFKRLLKKRIDAVPHVISVGKYILRTSLTPEEQAQITFSPTVIQKREYHVILSKKHEENKRFARLFNEGLQKIKENGTYNKLLEELNRGAYDKP
jgi:polar amino acid transport system substrate-binding protein